MQINHHINIELINSVQGPNQMSYTIPIHLYCSLPEHCSVSIITFVNLITDLHFTRCKSFQIYNCFQPIILRKWPYVPQRESINVLLFVGQKNYLLNAIDIPKPDEKVKANQYSWNSANLFTVLHCSLCKGRMNSGLEKNMSFVAQHLVSLFM